MTQYTRNAVTLKELAAYILTIATIAVWFINPIIFWAAVAQGGTALSLLWEAIVMLGGALVTLGSGLC